MLPFDYNFAFQLFLTYFCSDCSFTCFPSFEFSCLCDSNDLFFGRFPLDTFGSFLADTLHLKFLTLPDCHGNLCLTQFRLCCCIYLGCREDGKHHHHCQNPCKCLFKDSTCCFCFHSKNSLHYLIFLIAYFRPVLSYHIPHKKNFCKKLSTGTISLSP